MSLQIVSIPQTISNNDRSIIARMGVKNYNALCDKARKMAQKANKKGLSAEERDEFLSIPFFIRMQVIKPVTLNRI